MADKKEEELQDYIDEAEDDYDLTQDLQDSQLDQFGTYPTPKDKSDMYTWFWKVVELNEEPVPKKVKIPFKLAKVGYLNKDEVGWHEVSMRDAMNLAHLGDLFHHTKFAQYWANRARINATTSMARKGWFMDLSISQRRLRAREKSATSGEREGWRLFQKKKGQDQQEG